LVTERGNEYDARWRELEAAGENIHGEADLVESLLAESRPAELRGSAVLDAGCGTGRVAIELARRGVSVIGVDADAEMLATARANAPEIGWWEADLSDPDGVPAGPFDLVLLAGNVMIFLEPESEDAVLGNLAARLSVGGSLVSGFSVQPGQLSCDRYDQAAADAGLTPVARWATWDRRAFDGGDYAVMVHRRENLR
jgi:2-polyprenyl-3-methyl-5-hydroxy-6-metoxy-1,4-benzoquinol methylase